MVPSFELFKQYYVRMYKSFCQSKLDNKTRSCVTFGTWMRRIPSCATCLNSIYH
jgi:hypothetical protein